MKDDDIKKIIEEEMIREADLIMELVNADPALKDVEPPPELRDKLFAQIREYEEQKALNQLSAEEKELIRLGKIYKRRRKWNRYAVLVAALVALLALGSVSFGEGENILSIVKGIFKGGEQTIFDNGNTEPVVYNNEAEVYEAVKDTYGFTPAKITYLPEGIVYKEAVISTGIQGINIFYGLPEGDASIIYIIRPNYQESSFSTVVEDKKLREYQMLVNNVDIHLSEYEIIDSGENRWSVYFVHQDILYLLRITNLKQVEVEKIITNMLFN